ncbi:MAG: hypothetical protein NZ533_02465, partial [Casimicrobiaceae bacterium]|nr:hypothetical protein [Casimicrobiaceae bacterium]
LVVSPGGGWLASGSFDGTVRLWALSDASDPSAGVREVARLEGQKGGVMSLAVSPGGGWLASGSIEGPVRLWALSDASDPSAGVREVARLAGHRLGVRSLAVSPDGGWIVSGSDDGTVRIWKLADPGNPAAGVSEVRRCYAFADGAWAVLDPQRPQPLRAEVAHPVVSYGGPAWRYLRVPCVNPQTGFPVWRPWCPPGYELWVKWPKAGNETDPSTVAGK